MTGVSYKHVCNACNAVLATRTGAALALPWIELKHVLLENQAARADCEYGPCMYMREQGPRVKLSASPGEPLALNAQFARTNNASQRDHIVAKRIEFFPVTITYDYRHSKE